MLQAFNNIKISRKVSIAPVAILVMLIGVLVFSGSQFDASQNRMIVGADATRQKIENAKEIELLASNIQVKASIGLNWWYAKFDQEKIDAILQEAQSDLTQGLALIEAYRGLLQGDISNDSNASGELAEASTADLSEIPPEEWTELQRLDHVTSLWTGYQAAITRAITMLKINPAIGPVMMGRSSENYNQLSAELSVFVQLVISVSEADRQAILAENQSFQVLIMGLIVVVVILAVFITVVVGRAIAQPIRFIQGAMELMVNGEFDKIACQQYAGRHDEIGQMVSSLEVFQSALIKAQEAEEKDRQENEQRRHRNQLMRSSIETFKGNISKAMGGLSTSSTALEEGARTVGDCVSLAEKDSVDATVGSEAVNQNTQVVASATEELSASVEAITRQLRNATEIAANAVSQTQETADVIRSLSQNAESIGDMV